MWCIVNGDKVAKLPIINYRESKDIAVSLQQKMMNTYVVYHLNHSRITERFKELNFDISVLVSRPTPEVVIRAFEFEPPLYDKVAIIKARDFENAFMRTCHISQTWQEGEGVIWSTDARSSAIGDVIIEDNSRKRVFVNCVSFGEF